MMVVPKWSHWLNKEYELRKEAIKADARTENAHPVRRRQPKETARTLDHFTLR